MHLTANNLSCFYITGTKMLFKGKKITLTTVGNEQIDGEVIKMTKIASLNSAALTPR